MAKARSQAKKPKSQRPSLPDFKKPPVVEVVCGVTFEPLAKFLVHHVGFLWAQFSQQFPEVSEQPSLPVTIENFDGNNRIDFQFSHVMPWPRAFFSQPNGGDIIQVQRERFLYNWRKRAGEEYPRFDTVYSRFLKAVDTFSQFSQQMRIGDIVPVQFELTYLNMLVQGDDWATWEGIGRMFPGAPSLKETPRLLDEPQSVNWVTTYNLPDQQGRLHVTLRSGTRNTDKKPALLLDLTVRGMPKLREQAGVDAWFQLAREWIVRGFYEITSEAVQSSVWERTRP